MKEILHEGHLRECRCPPMRIPNGEDLELCSFYLDETTEAACSDLIAPDIEHDGNSMEADDGDDDDDDWESIGSNDDGLIESKSKTAIVLKFFENKAYKVRKLEEHAFANHYAE
jgi:hypothetical protein